MIQTVHMVCGVPGSGKSWVCEQLTEKFTYVRHDDFIKAERDLLAAIISAATKDKPVLMDCPFGERELKQKIEALGLKVKPWFIVEPTEIVKSRYLKRTGKALPQASVTRSASIINRANEWQAVRGPSSDIFRALSQLCEGL
jgi:uridine kinase